MRGSACVEVMNHLAWKRPVSSEACRGLHTAGGSLFVVPVLVQCPGLSGKRRHCQFELEDGYSASRHVVLEDTPSDLVTPPVLPVQMPATQTATSHDRLLSSTYCHTSYHFAHFVPIVIERRDTEMVRFIRVISSENLGGLSTGVSETVFFSGDTSVTRRELEFLDRDQMSLSSFISAGGRRLRR
ncbi:hypothetical protein CK203_114914 [Vitis vinifera]|uniref:Uncharacterized protein n=1 Tax=Vitis vinifera TaxID=29760 RepID=A0A438C4S8_VITVI|nr:hypothetical protein CK203_114914 [Vitis vinifera]